MRLIRSLLVFGFVLSPFAIGQSTSGPRTVEGISHPATQERLRAGHHGLQSFLARVGGEWTVQFDEQGGTPISIVGTGIPVVAGPISNLAQAEVEAVATLNRFPELWDCPIGQLRLSAKVKAGPLFIFTWDQLWNGLEVRGARVQIQVHQAGRIASLQSTTVAIPIGLNPRPGLASERIVGIVSRGKRILTGDAVLASDLVVFVVRAGGISTPRLAYVVTVTQPSADTFERVYVDANDGTVLGVTPARLEFTDVKGHVTANANATLSAIGTPTSVPVANATITITNAGGLVATVTTDANGDYLTTTAATAPFTATGSLTGANYAVTPAQGTALAPSQVTTTDPSGAEVANLTFNSSLTEFDTSQATGAYLHNVIRSYTLAKIPSFTPFTSQPILVNHAAPGSFYLIDGTHTLRFAAANSFAQANNLCFSTLFYHEFGHGVDDSFGGIQAASLSEALGDILAMYASGQAIIGQDYKTGEFIRTGENTKVWPVLSGCGPTPGVDPHCVGEPFMGFAWTARTQLIAALGSSAGIAAAENDFLGTFAANNLTIPLAVTQVFLLDDNDGNMSNGTPNYPILASIATSKGFTPPATSVITVSHTPYPDTWNQTQPFGILATAMTSQPGVSISSMELKYTIGDAGTLTSATMSATGHPNQFRGLIPAQVGPTIVSYQIIASNAGGYVVTLPGIGDFYRVAVGKRTSLFFDDLESGATGWSHGILTGSVDEWELGVPQTLGTNIFDPAAAYSGTHCWGNDLQLTSASQDGLYQTSENDFLDSPTIVSTGHTGVRIRYRRWLTVGPSSKNKATISISGTQLFINPSSGDLLDRIWTLHDLPAGTVADNSSGFKVRWRLQLVPPFFPIMAGGWNLDDVSVYALEATPVLSLTETPNTVSPPIGSTLVFSLTGTANAGWSMWLSGNWGPTTVDGVGVVEVGSDAAVVGSGTLSNGGTGSFSIFIPNDPGLSGLAMNWVGIATASGALPQIGNSVAVRIQ